MTDFYHDYNPQYIEHAYPATPLEEGVDYVWDDVMQADGTVKRMMIRRPRP